MSEEDDFDMLLDDDDGPAAAAILSDQATCTGLQRTGLGETAENGGASDDDKDGGAREWTADEVKLVEPCIKLIKVSAVFE